ncbi:hypothetical protein WKI13_09185 [Teredinibacter turnerae]|uniref:hypothetical protein n=1 Tax=Teredinibacter turnerae TaxID=2426 RepID=UPI0003654547|nr:hypothetical protein [Teredinibacter turnerae]
MNICEQIEFDLTGIKKYFDLICEKFDENPEWSYCHGSARYNAVVDIYGCLEFWLKRICDFRMDKDALKLTHKDIRGKNDLSGLNKYLEKVVRIDMSLVNKQYFQLQSLRQVRNVVIHSGAHSEEEKVNKIEGVSLAGTLLIISPAFIESSRINAREYLIHAATA